MRKTIIGGVAALLGCCTAFAQAKAHKFESLYAFGDSYTDSGAGYVDGNGPTAVVYLAQSLGIPLTYAGDPRSSGKSLNYAVSGAETGSADGLRSMGMQTQVLDFTARVSSGTIHFKPEKTLFFLAGGLNDKDLPTVHCSAKTQRRAKRPIAISTITMDTHQQQCRKSWRLD
jgi:cholinesterase